ncbi:MAG: META domain-containing protein [Flavobacteriaceae bacterium]
MKIYPILFVLCATLGSCASSLQESGSKTVWINSHKTACLEDSPIKCFQVQIGDHLDDSSWQTLFDPIEGFDYKPGKFYQIKIKVEENPEGLGFSYQYEKTIQEINDTLDPINGNWKLFALDGIPLSHDQSEIPKIRIDLPKMQISGKGNCNRLNAQISHFTEELIDFGPIMSTKMMCKEMYLEIDFMMNLEKTTHYLIVENQLVLMDINDNALLTFDRESKNL